MRVFLDACVLYPAVTRTLLMEAARQGAFEPCWSARVLEEWARAAGRGGPSAEAAARVEAAALQRDWPAAAVVPHPGVAARLSLPDPSDVHVLAGALAAGAAAIVTANHGDFPGRTLARHGLLRLSPDAALAESVRSGAADLLPAAEALRAARAPEAGLRGFLKRAGLPRTARALGPS